MIFALKVFAAMLISVVTLVACCTYHPPFGTPWSDIEVSNPDLKEERINSFDDPEIVSKITERDRFEELQAFLEGYPFGWYPPLPESPGAGYLVEFRTSEAKRAWLALSPADSKYIWVSWQRGGDYFDYDSARMHPISREEYDRLRKILGVYPRPTLF